jgi:uncharacterized membrane protein YgdD (TMEM256/DUF423 family)
VTFVSVGAIFGFLSVALGAFGAHALRDKLSAQMLGVYEKGVMYQMYHALALLGVGILFHLGPSHQLLSIAGWLFALGIVLFSGSLYMLSLSGKRAFGAITPIGGLCFLAGWALVFFAVV